MSATVLQKRLRKRAQQHSFWCRQLFFCRFCFCRTASRWYCANCWISHVYKWLFITQHAITIGMWNSYWGNLESVKTSLAMGIAFIEDTDAVSSHKCSMKADLVPPFCGHVVCSFSWFTFIVRHKPGRSNHAGLCTYCKKQGSFLESTRRHHRVSASWNGLELSIYFFKYISLEVSLFPSKVSARSCPYPRCHTYSPACTCCRAILDRAREQTDSEQGRSYGQASSGTCVTRHICCLIRYLYLFSFRIVSLAYPLIQAIRLTGMSLMWASGLLPTKWTYFTMHSRRTWSMADDCARWMKKLSERYLFLSKAVAPACSSWLPLSSNKVIFSSLWQ